MMLSFGLLLDASRGPVGPLRWPRYASVATASAGPAPLIQTLTDSDVALEWAALLAARWLESNALETLGPGSPPEHVRAAVIDVVGAAAAALAASAERGGAELCRGRAVLRRWLALRVDDLAQPDSRTGPARLTLPPLRGPGPAASA